MACKTFITLSVIFLVPCSFENGLCGLVQDRQSDFLWSSPGSGRTPTAGTGPKFDHTTLSPKGTNVAVIPQFCFLV
jgi:hypothetical protein